MTTPVNAEEVKTDRLGGGDSYISVDAETGRIAFVIKGEEKAFLDEDGLHVSGDVAYGGTLTDTGTAYFDEQVKTREASDADGEE